jgi:hypothetical protein
MTGEWFGFSLTSVAQDFWAGPLTGIKENTSYLESLLLGFYHDPGKYYIKIGLISAGRQNRL